MNIGTKAWRWRNSVRVLVSLLVAAAAGVSIWFCVRPKEPERQPPVADLPTYRPAPVAAHRDGQVPDGFRGEVHPVLHGTTRLHVAARMTPLGLGRDQLEQKAPWYVYKMFTDLKVATESQVYTEREFSGLLPDNVETAGQMWKIEPDVAAGFLRQFHPRPSMHLIAFGRRAGPDGAFGILRAVSPTHLDILFRVHAEFDIADNVWLTPACLWGRMAIHKPTGVVESFRMWVPTDNPLNIHLTVAESVGKGEQAPSVFREIERGDLVIANRDIVRVEAMELVSDQSEMPDDDAWSESLDLPSAFRQLRAAFYAFEEVNWVAWDQATTVAADLDKPILAVVLWGALDDQSC